MTEVSEAVAAAARGTPYIVVDTKKGFVVQLDVVTPAGGPVQPGRLESTSRWCVIEQPSHFTITGLHIRLKWVPGCPG